MQTCIFECVLRSNILLQMLNVLHFFRTRTFWKRKVCSWSRWNIHHITIHHREHEQCQLSLVIAGAQMDTWGFQEFQHCSGFGELESDNQRLIAMLDHFIRVYRNCTVVMLEDNNYHLHSLYGLSSMVQVLRHGYWIPFCQTCQTLPIGEERADEIEPTCIYATPTAINHGCEAVVK